MDGNNHRCDTVLAERARIGQRKWMGIMFCDEVDWSGRDRRDRTGYTLIGWNLITIFMYGNNGMGALRGALFQGFSPAGIL